MAQAVSRRPHTSEARVRAQFSSCEICGGQNALGQVFIRVFRFPLSISIHLGSPCQYITRDWTIGPLVAAVQRHRLTPSTWATWTWAVRQYRPKFCTDAESCKNMWRGLASPLYSLKKYMKAKTNIIIIIIIMQSRKLGCFHYTHTRFCLWVTPSSFYPALNLIGHTYVANKGISV
jgi:hypothetical protein